MISGNIASEVCPKPGATAGGPSGARRPISCPHQLRGWHFSRHARDRIDARGFDPHEVVLVCCNPQITVTAYHRGPNLMRHVAGRLAVVVDVGTGTIVTAWPRLYFEWNDSDAREAAGYGR